MGRHEIIYAYTRRPGFNRGEIFEFRLITNSRKTVIHPVRAFCPLRVFFLQTAKGVPTYIISYTFVQSHSPQFSLYTTLGSGFFFLTANPVSCITIHIHAARPTALLLFLIIEYTSCTVYIYINITI